MDRRSLLRKYDCRAGLWSLWCCGITEPDPELRVEKGKYWFDINFSYNLNPGMPSGKELQWFYYYLMTAAKAFTMHNYTDFGVKTADWYVDFRNHLINTLQGPVDGHWGPLPKYFPYTDVGPETDDICTAEAILALETRASVIGGSLQIVLSTKADLHLYDSEGRHVGIDYITGMVDLEIPGSSYSGPDTSPQVITITCPLGGGYEIKIVGKVTEPYILTVNSYIGTTLSYSKSITDAISADRIHVYTAIISNIVGPMVDLRTVIPIPAIIDIDPDTLNLKSKGRWITCYIEIRDYHPSLIDISSILLNDTLMVVQKPGADDELFGQVGDYNNNGVPDLMVKFDRAELQSILPVGESVEVKVSGIVDDIEFRGTDVIRVIDGSHVIANNPGKSNSSLCATIIPLNTTSSGRSEIVTFLITLLPIFIIRLLKRRERI
jgi:hypothetical protein